MQELRDLLKAAFSRQRFGELLLRLDKRLDDYVGPNDDVPTAFMRVVDAANQELWWRDLVRAARNANPVDAGLLAYGENWGVSPRVTVAQQAVAGAQLELKIRDTGTTFDIGPWRNALGQIEGRVCRIEYPEQTGQATGFLVGPDLVLTNYHVVKPFVDKPDVAATVALRFDYKVSDEGVAVQPGIVYRLAQPEWLEFSSPYSSADEQTPPPAETEADKLDLAFLRVAGRPGEDPVGGPTQDPNPVPRGWIEAPVQDYDFGLNPALYIVQHPDGKPLQIALDTEAVIELNQNATRVRYKTTTEPGSSGSPCFGPDWEWVALHHMGDPKYLHLLKPEFNQGIPVAAIRALLAAEERLDLLGGG